MSSASDPMPGQQPQSAPVGARKSDALRGSLAWQTPLFNLQALRRIRGDKSLAVDQKTGAKLEQTQDVNALADLTAKRNPLAKAVPAVPTTIELRSGRSPSAGLSARKRYNRHAIESRGYGATIKDFCFG